MILSHPLLVDDLLDLAFELGQQLLSMKVVSRICNMLFPRAALRETETGYKCKQS